MRFVRRHQGCFGPFFLALPVGGDQDANLEEHLHRDDHEEGRDEIRCDEGAHDEIDYDEIAAAFY